MKKFPGRLLVTALEELTPLLGAACFGAFLVIANEIFGLDFFNKGGTDEE